MLLDSRTLSRGRLAFYVWFAVCVACTPPDGSVLFEPLALNGTGGSSAGSAGIGGGGAGGAGAAGEFLGAGGASGVPSEGLGGALSFAGAAGIAGGSSGEVFEADAAVPDAVDPVVDAGLVEEEDAGPPPIVCEPGAEQCDGLDNDCDELVDEGQTCADECVGFALEDHGYMLCIEAVDRGIALARCAAEDMKLVWLETPEENVALVSTIAELIVGGGEVLIHIGASDGDDEDEWSWIGNGAAFDGFQFWEGNAAEDADADAVGNAYENWADGEPNNTDGEDCGVLSVRGNDNRAPGEWDDRNCDVELPFLCEVP